MSTLLQDIRFGARLLLKDRTFTITALLTLAICLGANAAMFTVVRSVLLKPLPFPDSDRVVLLYNSYPNAGAPRVGAAVPDYFDRLTAVPALDMQSLFRREGMTFGDESGAERLASIRTTPSFFRVVHVEPIIGRVFTDDEGEVGKNQKALLSYALLEAQVRRHGLDRRHDDPAQWQRVRRRRRAAAGVHVPAERHRPVRAGGICAGRQGRRPPAQQQLADDRPPACRRHDRSSAAAGRCAQRLERCPVSGLSPDPERRQLPYHHRLPSR